MAEIIDLQRVHSRERMAAQCGPVYRVLVEGPSKKDSEEYQGRNTYNGVVVFPKGDAQIGQYVYVRTTKCMAVTLRGELISDKKPKRSDTSHEPAKRQDPFRHRRDSSGLERALATAVRVAPADITVLVRGESGTGKEALPKIIHHNSARKHGAYIAVNCGAIPEGTIDSELFGHEKGSFTGAHEARKGYFEEADGGTVFLDEVGELPLATQARLLRVLETGEYLRVGSSKVRKTDVRVVAATNLDFEQAMVNGKFREDLYYRLNQVPLMLPPLRDRGDDIHLLFRKFTGDFSERHHMPPIRLGPRRWSF